MAAIGFWISYSILYLISLLPFGLLYLLSDGLYHVLYRFIGYRRKVVRNNLQNSFPEKTAAEILEIEQKYYRYLADNMLESIKMLSMSERSINKRFVFKGEEKAVEFLKNNQSVLLATSHYGNWEWAALGTTSHIKFPAVIVYKPLTNKHYEKLINRVRSRFGGILSPMKLTVRKFVEQEKKGAFMGVLVSDQTPSRNEKNQFIKFLNQPTAVLPGLEKIGQLTGSPIFYVNIERIRRGYYQAVFSLMVEHPKASKPGEITEIYNRRLESIIREKPEFWLWSHKRWKHQPPKEYHEKNA